MLKKIFLLLFYTYLTAVSTVIAKGSGTSSGLTLVYPVSPRAAGMAEACASIPGEIQFMHYNPASIALFSGMGLSASYQKGFANDTFASIIIGKNLSSTILLNLGRYISSKVSSLSGKSFNTFFLQASINCSASCLLILCCFRVAEVRSTMYLR